MVQTEEERRAKRREYYQKNKEKICANAKSYRKTPQGKSYQKAYNKKYQSRPAVKVSAQKSRDLPENKKKMKAYNATSKAKSARIQHKQRNLDKYREYGRKSAAKPENKERIKKIRDNTRLKLLHVYSKRLSNSDIPCCNCCGLNSHIDFLAIDHIQGKYRMNSIDELVELGYSSKLRKVKFLNWLIDTNYLSDLQTEYFQILCHNCNKAKANPINNNECPMKGRLH